MEKESGEKTFYITTTLPYVNSEPHIGFAMELIRADIIARWKKIQGYDVFFNTGTDEHGVKVYRKAIGEKKDTQEYADLVSKNFKDLVELLDIDKDIHFVRTTDTHHKKAAQEFWKRCKENGYIYKKNYKVKYCVGCELEKTESELINDHCILHPNLEIELIDEENYFFKFSEFQSKLLALYDANPNFVIPQTRFNEIRAFVERGLDDFSISRLKEKMPWGVPVTDDESQVMYVWFDALVSYISTLGWPEDKTNFEKFWVHGTPTQYAGKDNLRQQSAMWQAMLMSVNLPPSNQIVINGFINSRGQKMSKSLGNVANPKDIVDEYGVDALRYFVARELSTFEDSDYTSERFKEVYNANLANGLGNLVSRIMTMAKQYGVNAEARIGNPIQDANNFLNVFDIKQVMDKIWWHVGDIDKFIAQKKPFFVYKTDPETAKKDVLHTLFRLQDIAVSLNSFMPETSKTILSLIKENKIPEKPLFARKD